MGGEGSAPGADPAQVSALCKASSESAQEKRLPDLCAAAGSSQNDAVRIMPNVSALQTGQQHAHAYHFRSASCIWQEVDDLPLLRGAGSSSGRALGTSAAVPKELLKAGRPGRYQA